MLPAPVRYRDRITGELVEERVFGERALRFLYGGAGGRLVTWLAARHRLASKLYGLAQRSPRSAARIPSFVAALGIDATEAAEPIAAYRSLDDFFARKLRPGARPVTTDARELSAPAEGRVLVLTRLRDAIAVKGSAVGLAELLGDGELAARYSDGSAAIFRLAPADYHRFHFPDEGSALPHRALGRHLHSVHPIALAAGAPSFRNYRHSTLLCSAGFGDLVMCEVGALCVGSIVQTYRPGYVARGAEKGLFRFGGSTVMLLAHSGRVAWDADLVENSAQGIETLVRVGSRIGSRPG